jgi:hypothetical protein
MIKTGAVVLSALLIFGGANLFANRGIEDETKYCDTVYTQYDVSTAAEIETSVINYSTKTIDKYDLALRCPSFEYSPAYGSCAAIAGGNLVGFFDRYNENLIPNHKSGTAIGNTYMYNTEDAAVQAVIRELYTYMGTTTSGTTEKQFINGVTEYCKVKGSSITFSSCMTSGSFSYTKAQSYLKNNQPIVFFLNSYNVTQITEQDKKDGISTYVSNVPHIMIGFGYKTYVYDGNTTYRYCAVASGVSGYATGLFDINHNTKINNALAVSIS